MTLDNLLRSIGRRIRTSRKKLLLTQREISSQTGISYRYYQSIESGGANITIDTLLRIALCFKVHPGELLPTKAEP